MISSLTVGNFKAFGRIRQIPIRPITLIFGPNSVGKSSLLQSLLLLHELERKSEIRWTYEDPYRGMQLETKIPSFDVRHMQLSGDLIDLGGYKNFVHRHEEEGRVTLGLEFQLGHPVIQSAVMAFEERRRGRNPSKVLFPTSPERVLGLSISFGHAPTTDRMLCIHSAEISFDHDWVLKLGRCRYPGTCGLQQDTLAVKAVNMDHQSLGTHFSKLKIPDPEDDQGCVLTAFPEALVHDGVLGDRSVLDQLVLVSRQILKLVCGSFEYLGGLRVLPPRDLPLSDSTSANWRCSGMAAYASLVDKPELLEEVNRWLTEPDMLDASVELKLRTMIDTEQLDLAALMSNCDQVSEATIRRRLGKFRASLRREGVPALIFQDRQTKTILTHRDLGLGISQLLPVLVSAGSQADRIIMIEQPELHLHPRLQARLGDVFVKAALPQPEFTDQFLLGTTHKNNFILETHSEHLILRILRRVRETTRGTLPSGIPAVRPEDVSVVYLQPGPDGIDAVPLPVTSDGDFSAPWPNGFFTERAEDLF